MRIANTLFEQSLSFIFYLLQRRSEEALPGTDHPIVRAAAQSGQ